MGVDNLGVDTMGRLRSGMTHLSVLSNRKAMIRNWSNQKTNPALKTITGNK